RFISQLRESAGVEVTISDLFARPVLRDFARVVEGAARTALPPITPAERGGTLPLSFAPPRVWVLAQVEGGGGALHILWGMRLKGELDRSALGQALDRIVARHEALRTTFVSVDGEVAQRIAAVEDSRFQLAERDLRRHGGPQSELSRLIAEEAQTSFD